MLSIVGCNPEKMGDSRLHIRECLLLNNHSTKLYLALKPLILTMKVFGLYFLDKTGLGGHWKTKVLLGYSLVNVVVLWGLACMHLSKLTRMKGLEDVISNGNKLIWNFYVASQGSALFIMCLRKKGWQDLFHAHERVLKGPWKSDVHIRLKKRIIVYVMFCWILLLILGGISIYTYFYSPAFNNSLAFRCFMFIYHLYQIMFWVVPLTLTVVINDLLASEFNFFNKKLKSEVQKCPPYLCKSLRIIRYMYLRLADMVTSANTIVSDIMLVSITANVVTICSQLYNLIYKYEDDYVRTINQGIFLLCAIVTLMLTIGTSVWMKERVIRLPSIGYIDKQLTVVLYIKSDTL